MATVRASSAAADIATIKASAEWMGTTLAVRRRSSTDQAIGVPRCGVIRNFDLASVFTEGRRMEHFSSVEELAQVWEVVRPRRSG